MAVILMTGGSGLIGANLTRQLRQRNHEVVVLTRNRKLRSNEKGLSYSYWEPLKGVMDASVLENCDHIIHLAGAGVMDKKWTAEYKELIVDSRVQTAQLLIENLRQKPHRVKTFVSASAIGFYGGDKSGQKKEGFTEADIGYHDFLAKTCLQWEAASEAVTEMGIRRVVLRQGIVLANEGGAFKEYKTPLKFGVATIFGSGKQIMSWIHIEDVCRMYSFAIENDFVHGIYNAVAPVPVSQKEFMVALGENMRGRFFTTMHVPVFLLKLMLGSRSFEILKSATVSARKIRGAGFNFLYPNVEGALKELVLINN